ncbi:hypothetical protein HBI23_129520 [Parastagonospora nodorum]|nr:hypothetical protein HBI12_071510 [Parastagonospora nodorum]KAH5442414.1 hypothetical protein HBI47_029030 [Parastagonospora nodorum]KAH5660123.1 hypothetical protein HBI23_129520 [Parastagonospora nodorum]
MTSEETAIKRMTPKELAHAIAGPVTTIEVGSERKRYHVHTELLKYHSSSYKSYFNDLGDRNVGAVLEIPDTSFRAFNLFVHYIDTQSMPLDQDKFMDLINQPGEEGGWTEHTPVETTKGFLLAEKLSAPGFRATINKYFMFVWNQGLCEWFDKLEMHDMATAMINKVPQERVIWQFLVDECCLPYKYKRFVLNVAEDKEGEEGLSREFLLRCMRRFRELVEESEQGNVKKRCYLEHLDSDQKEDCFKLHMRYDKETGHEHFE